MKKLVLTLLGVALAVNGQVTLQIFQGTDTNAPPISIGGTISNNITLMAIIQPLSPTPPSNIVVLLTP